MYGTIDAADITLREARESFYIDNGFPADGGVGRDRWPLFGCRDLKVYLPNFNWRRKAIPLHDLHHILTGYPFSPTGEFQIAAWEFAAGRYPNVHSTLFCLPLVSMGVIVTPRKTLAAFIRGRRSNTLYSIANIDGILDRTVAEMRAAILPSEETAPRLRDYWQFAKLVVASSLLTLSPFALLLAAYWLMNRP